MCFVGKVIGLCADLQVLVLLAEVSQVARGEELGDEVDALGFGVMPGSIAFYDVRMVQINALLKLANDRCHLLIAQSIGFL